MELSKSSFDLILVPISLFLNTGYHAFLWYSYKNKHSPTTSIGANAIRRRLWFQKMIEDKEKNAILVVQSLRNSIMTAIQFSTTAILLTSSLAAQTNNAYETGPLLHNPIYGSESGPASILKWATASFVLLLSFLCNSMAIGCLSDASFTVSVSGEMSPGFVDSLIERGSVLAWMGTRMLYGSVLLLVWIFGPVPMALASIAMVWVLYKLDFTHNGVNGESQKSSRICRSY